MITLADRDGYYVLLQDPIFGTHYLCGPRDDLFRVFNKGRSKHVGSIRTSKAQDDAGNKNCSQYRADGTIFHLPDNTSFREEVWDCANILVRTEPYQLNEPGRTSPFSIVVGAEGGSYSTTSVATNWGRTYDMKLDVSISPFNSGVGLLTSYGVSKLRGSEVEVHTKKVSMRVTIDVTNNRIDYVYDKIEEYTTALGTQTYPSHSSWWQNLSDQIRSLSSLALGDFPLSLNHATYSEVWDSYIEYSSSEALWGRMCGQAVESMAYLDSNLIASIIDFKNIVKSTKDQVEASKKVLDSLQSKELENLPKLLSDADLSNRYGLQLTLSDAGEIGKAIERLRQDLKYLTSVRKIRSRSSAQLSTVSGLSVDASFYYLARVSQSGPLLQKVMQSLYEWDAYPSLGNMWDLFPYSFAIDWLVDFGGFFESIDVNLMMNQYTLLSKISTWKLEYSGLPAQILEIPGPTTGVAGSIKTTLYERHVGFNFDLPPIELHADPTRVLDHLVEATELIIQRL